MPPALGKAELIRKGVGLSKGGLHAAEPRRREGWEREGFHRGTRHLRAAEAKKGMLRGDPDAINNGFFIVARSLDVRSPCWCIQEELNPRKEHVQGRAVCWILTPEVPLLGHLLDNGAAGPVTVAVDT